MDTHSHSPAARSIRNYSIAAAFTIVVLLFGLGGWAAMVKLSGAVIGAGTVVVDGNVKRIQHREGGIVGKIITANHRKWDVNTGEALTF